MLRVLCRFALWGLALAPLPAAFAQEKEVGRDEPPPGDVESAPDRRAHLVLEPGGHAAKPTSVVFTPDGKRLVSAAEDQTVQVWDVQTKERLRVIRPPVGTDGQGSIPHHLVVDRRGERVAFWVEVKGDEGRKVRTTFVCSLQTGEAQALPGGGALAFAADGTALAVGDGHEVRLVDLKTGKPGEPVSVLPAKDKNKILSVAFAPDGGTLAVAVGDARVRLLDGATLKSRHTWTAPGAGTNLGGVGWADDRTLVCRSWSREKALMVLDAGTGELKKAYPLATLFQHLPEGRKDTEGLVAVNAVAGTTKALVRTTRTLKGGRHVDVSFLLDWSTGQTSPPYVHETTFGCPVTAVTPDLSLGVQGNSDLNEIHLWDPQTGAALRDGKVVRGLKPAVRGASGWKESIRWRPDGKAVAWERLTGGWAELDLTTLTLKNIPQAAFREYGRGILQQSGPLTVQSLKDANFEVTGGPQAVKGQGCRGVCSWDLTFVAGGHVVTHPWATAWLQQFDPATGQLLSGKRVVRSHIESWALSPRPEGRYLLIGSGDQTLTVFNPAANEVLLTVFPVGHDWIAWTPDGYYAATPGGERRMGWLVDNGPERLASFYPAERFRQQFYKPEVIKLLLDKGSVKEALKSANVEATDVEKVLPPQASLRKLEQTQAQVTLRVTAHAREPQDPLQSLRLLVDGRPLVGAEKGKGLEDVPGGKLDAEAVWNVELPPGPHELKVLARTPRSAAPSEAVEVDVPSPAAARPALRVVSVGINEYPNKDLRLKFAVKDAGEVAAAFHDDCAGRANVFGDAPVVELLDREATRAGVLKALQDVRKQAKTGDLVVVYFAGHGITQDKDFYLLTVDADVNRPAKTALSGKELRKQLADIPCQVLLILDACHSAAGIKAFKSAADEAARELSDDECGVAVLCAAMGTEYAEEKDGNGLFTKALVEALRRTRDVPYNHHDHRQYVHHLHAYVLEEVQAASDDRQHPFLSLPWVTQPFAVRLLPQRAAGR
jgi:WD40 repeat protein